MDTSGDGSPDEEEVPSLHIPIQSSNSSSSSNNNNSNNEDENLFVEIFPEELSHTSVATLLQVLRDEAADVQVWCEAGQLYVRLGKARQALTLLQDACDVPTSDKAKRVRTLAATGIASLLAATRGGSKGNNNSGSTGGDPDWTAADTRFTQAGKVDTFFPMTWIGRGMLNLERRSLDQARFFFQTTKKQCGLVLPALLGMAAVLLAEQDYKGALAEYGTAMRRFPVGSGAAARVGLAICAYQLGQVDRSRAAFARALQLDPEYVPALVGTAVLDMRAIATQDADFGQRMEHAIKLMSVANLLDSSNAMVQNHLANHYFWKWTPVRSWLVLCLDYVEPNRMDNHTHTLLCDCFSGLNRSRGRWMSPKVRTLSRRPKTCLSIRVNAFGLGRPLKQPSRNKRTTMRTNQRGSNSKSPRPGLRRLPKD
jgi:RNA polymerase-associated protein CTR9